MLNTTLCYLEEEGKLLLLHRTKKQKDPNAGKWIGIGGKLEPGEAPEDCLLREFREETGLLLENYRYRGLVTFVPDDKNDTEYMHLFTSTRASGLLTGCDEGDLQWVEKDTAQQLPMWEGDRVFFKLLETEENFFSLKLVYQGEKLVEAILYGEGGKGERIQ